MTECGLRLRSVFLAGCIILALPGLVASSLQAVQACTAWLAARAAARGTLAAGETMRAATALMVERGHLQAAALALRSKEDATVRSAAESDLALMRTERTQQAAGLPIGAVEQTRASLALARSRADIAVQKGSVARIPFEQFNRLIESLDEQVSRLERKITLANPSVGIIVGLARNANEIRALAGRRGSLLNTWLGGQDVTPAQQDELLALNGRLAGAWERLQRGVRTAGLPPALIDAVSSTDSGFFVEEDPWYRELVKIAVSGGGRPFSHAQYRAWSIKALETLLPLRDTLITEAKAQSDAAMGAARRNLAMSMGGVLVSLVLVVAAVVALLRSLVEPVRSMTATMTALAAGDLTATATAYSRLHEINAMAAAVVVFRENVVSLHARETELWQTNRRFAAALENMSQGLTMFDANEHLAVFNHRFCEIAGLPAERVRLGMSLRDMIALSVEMGNYPGLTAEQAYADRRIRLAQLSGGSHYDELRGEHAISVRCEPMTGGGWVATFEDVTERREAEARIAHMARHDALTGLPNRVLLREHMEHVLARSRRGGSAAVLCLDLDGFKSVNDTLGHPAGDELLRQVALRLREATRETDLVARLGGDEFAIIQADAQQLIDGAASLADRLVEALRLPFDLHGQSVTIGASVGIAPVDDADATPDELLRNADIALYRAKAAGRGTCRFFEPGMDADLQRRRLLEADLRRALAEEQFEVYYQPLFAAKTEALVGFEALLRWRHPEKGLVNPGEFIPLAEEIGLIRPIGAWVLARACADAADWPEHVRVAVNLSPVQFTTDDLVKEVERALAASGLTPPRLELEITESALLQDNDATLRVLHRLRALGVRISMDDFGTGYSSLSYLRRFPFDKIKVDQSFVRNLEQDSGNVAIVRAVVGLGKALGMGVLAEGVETRAQLSLLRDEGCDELQGYLFSKPQPSQCVPEIIASHPAAKGCRLHGPVLVMGDGQEPVRDLSRIA